jgi:glyceraldehyde 3-phosphate dehydrogenase
MIKVAINGFGRIGRSVFRVLSSIDNIEVVGINDLFDNKTLAYLLQYDTVMGVFRKNVDYDDTGLIVEGKHINITNEKDPACLKWADLSVDVVIEATGIFRDRASLEKHLEAGAKRVVLTVPPKDEIDAMVVMGVNDTKLTSADRLVSNASCTTNCLAPIAYVLDKEFGIEDGLMTTVHAYTNDQRLADVPHKDFRRSRAAAENIIPTTTGAAKAVGKILPHLEGRLDGMAVRVPISDGSIVDLVVRLKTKASGEDINAAIEHAAQKELKGILQFSQIPLVSSDIVGNPHSSIFDSLLTQSQGDGYTRVVSWYDNEWGYSNRVADLVSKLAALD